MTDLHSRVHPLRSFGERVYVKREDELSFGISGSKLRKYASLVPYLLAQGAQEVAVIGSAHSNNVLGLCQALIENGLQPQLFLLKPHDLKSAGNFAFTALFTDRITWVERAQWKGVEQLAEKQFQWVIPEGSNHPAALAGSKSLADDILRNEKEHGFSFEQIFLEVGTGMMARGLIERFAELNVQRQIHLILIASTAAEFLHRLGVSYPTLYFHQPLFGRSFGSQPTAAKEWVRRLARKEGMLIDPLYGAKLFATFASLNPLAGRKLIIHSGGALSLSGYLCTNR